MEGSQLALWFKCIIVILESMPLGDQVVFQSGRVGGGFRRKGEVTDVVLVAFVVCLINQEKSCYICSL